MKKEEVVRKISIQKPPQFFKQSPKEVQKAEKENIEIKNFPHASSSGVRSPKRFSTFLIEQKEFLIQLATVICATAISFFSFLYYYSKNYVLLYDDAASHLNIAKRVIGGLRPGFGQFGAVWLPLQHFLMLPFIWNDFLWHSGIAGSIVSMISYIITVLFSYKTAKLFTKSSLGGIVSAIVIASNLNFIYMQTTPLSEPLMLAVVSVCLYFLLSWSHTDSIPQLIAAAFFALLASMTRYEGWFLVVFSSIYVFFIYFKKESYQKAESATILFCSLAFFGIGLWIVFSWILMGTPMYFLTGPFSAHAQQNVIAKASGLPTKHNIPLSFLVYWWDIIDIIGLPVVIISIIFFIITIFKKENWKKLGYLLTVASLPLLIIFTLVVGITVVYVPQVPTHHVQGELFNVRYGLMALPFIAFCSSLLVRKRVWLAIPIIFVTLVQQFYFLHTNSILTITDGVLGASAMRFSQSDMSFFQALHKTCNKKLILMTQVSKDPVLFKTEIEMKYFITEAAFGYWQTSLKDPTKYAYCVVMGPHDSSKDTIRTALIHNKKFLENYTLAFKNASYVIYKKI